MTGLSNVRVFCDESHSPLAPFSFLLLGVGLILLSLFEFYLGWDVAHSATVLIQY